MSGHLPIGADSDPRAATVSPDEDARDRAVAGAGVGPLPLDHLVRDLRLLTAKAYAMVRSPWDPASGPQQQDAPLGPDFVDIQLGKAAADFRSALRELDELRQVLAAQRPARGFSLPVTPRFEIPGTSEIAAGINEALSRRSR